jgi:AraC-like DNA-binding protein
MNQADVPLLTFLSPPLPYFIESDRRVYAPGEEHPNRANMGKFDLLFVHSGTLYIGEEKRTWVLGPGELLILRPDSWHYSTGPCQEKTEFDWLHFHTAGGWEETEPAESGKLRGDYYVYAIRLPKTMKVTYPEQVKENFTKLHEAAHATSHAAFWQRQQLFLHLLQMFDEGWRNDAAPTSVNVSERAASFMKMNYRKPVSNRELGEAMHLHPNYIARCMIEVFGCTPQQYLMLYRLDQAKLLLIKTDWPISRVAEETGFRQTPHFSRCFSEHAGLSPLQYRKQYTG